MNRKDLKFELDKLGVNQSLYSLYGNLECDRIILYENYHRWEVFYLSERGTRENLQVFFTEKEACDYILNLFRNNKIRKKSGTEISSCSSKS